MIRGTRETRSNVTTVTVTLTCDCGGEMRSTGIMLASYPPQYPHKCNACGGMSTEQYQYPRIEYQATE